MSVSDDMTKLASGLVVHKSAVEKTRRVMRAEIFTKIRRLIGILSLEPDKQIVTIFACRKCKKTLNLSLDKLDMDRPGGRPKFACDCTEWIVRG